MPIFDYKCQACDIKVERMVKTADSEVICNDCSGPMTKLVCAPRASGYKMVGAGFYQNDKIIDEMRAIKRDSDKLEKQLAAGK